MRGQIEELIKGLKELAEEYSPDNIDEEESSLTTAYLGGRAYAYRHVARALQDLIDKEDANKKKSLYVLEERYSNLIADIREGVKKNNE